MSRIGFVGLGMMGAAMALRLCQQGHDVTVWNRTAKKITALEEAGAHVSPSLDALCSSIDLIVSMVSTSDVVEEIAAAVRRSGAKGTVHADMSTVSPDTTTACEKEAGSVGQTFVHAPVLGSVPQVADGSLLIFAGGEDAAVERALPVLHDLGRKVYRFARAPEATHLKLACNFFIASMITTLGQGLSFASKAGLDGSVLLDVLASSALAAPMYATKGKNIIDGNFAPRFFLDHMLKDIRLFREAATKAGAFVPFCETLETLFASASNSGSGQEDYSAVVKVI